MFYLEGIIYFCEVSNYSFSTYFRFYLFSFLLFPCFLSTRSCDRRPSKGVKKWIFDTRSFLRLGGNTPRLNKAVKTKKNACTGGVTTDSTAWKKTKVSQPLTLFFSLPLKGLI